MCCPFCGSEKPCASSSDVSWSFGCIYCNAVISVTFEHAGSKAVARRKCEELWNARVSGPDWACPCCACEIVTTFDAEATWLGRHDGKPGPATITFARCADCELTLAGWIPTPDFWEPMDPRVLWRIRRPAGNRERVIQEALERKRAIEAACASALLDRVEASRQENVKAIQAWLREDPRRQVVVESLGAEMQLPMEGGCLGSAGLKVGFRILHKLHNAPIPDDQRVVTKMASPEDAGRFSREVKADASRHLLQLLNLPDH